MFIFNVTEPLTLILVVLLSVFVIILGKETKKSLVPAIMLFVFLAILIMHAIQYMISSGNAENLKILTRCLTLDFVFIFISFFAYLWIDDIDTKEHNKKSIDDSLDWFWNKV